jgi:hypothetical protein
MKRPRPKYEIYTKIYLLSNCINITVESNDMAERVELEAAEFGAVLPMRTNLYSIYVRETFDIKDVGRWLGRGGIVQVHGHGILEEPEQK